MRRAKTIAFLTAILAVSLAPAIALRVLPREASALMLAPVWIMIGSRTGFSSESVAAVWMMISFVLATVTASCLLVVLVQVLTRSVRPVG